MRLACEVAFVSLALAAPFVARAENGTTIGDIVVIEKSDLWDSWRAQALTEYSGDDARAYERFGPSDAHARNDSKTEAFHEDRSFRFVDTFTPRSSGGSTTLGTSHEPGTTHEPVTPRTGGYPPPRVVPIVSAPYLAAPELNAGITATGLTLLLGGLAVLRGRRTRLDPL
jgi:hypothetical protein